MNKRIITMTIISLATVFLLGLFIISRAQIPKSARYGRSIQKSLNQASESIKEGRLLEAKQIYSEIIEQHPDSELIKTAQKELENLNIKILFSPIKTENSVVYVVQNGDSLEKIAKRFNTTIELLIKSNNLASVLIHPGKNLKITKAKFSIIIDKSQNTLTLKADDEVLKVYTVSTGVGNSTPTGKFKIVNKLVSPVWYKAGAIVPSGSPENILGSRWMGLSIARYGIHGTIESETIGKQITAGCVRMLNEEVEELYAIVPEGTEVMIVD